MNRRIRLGIVFITAVLAAAGCRQKTQVAGLSLDVSFSEATLSDNLITDVTYQWKTAPDFAKLDRDYNVFVHFWHNENLLFQDDFVPEPPMTQWEPDRTYTVKRRIYIPQFIDEFDPAFKGEETLRLSAGIFNPFDRSGSSNREVLTRKLKIVPPPLGTPEVIYESGWYDLEVDQNSILKQWRWTAKEARCVVDNPRRDAVLVIKGGANIEVVPGQKIAFKINDLTLDEFVAQDSLFDKSYDIKKEMLGDKDEFILTIAVDRPFIPSKTMPNSKDERELGLQVSFVYFR